MYYLIEVELNDNVNYYVTNDKEIAEMNLILTKSNDAWEIYENLKLLK
ncbi:MAG: hypothetical protein ACOCVF_03100 [bacterium]